MNKCLIFLLLFFPFNKTHGAIHVKYANQIMNTFINDMEKKYKICCCGSGGGMAHDVEEFMIGFTAYRPASIQEARELEVALTEVFLSRINANETIRPFLREYPFPTNRINIFIAFEKKDGSSFSENNIAFVTHARNSIYYSKKDQGTNKYVNFYEEPYDEALRIVKKQD